MNFLIEKYDSSCMFNEVKDLFISEYGTEHIGLNGEFFKLFYDSNFQKEKVIAIVAKHEGKICGFQAIFYWPYIYNGIELNTYQSGNSLVHPNYRGKGLFALMLKDIESKALASNVDFLIGFPVQMSFNSFIKAGWINTFNLQWHIKIINLSTLFNKQKIKFENFEVLSKNTKNFFNKDENFKNSFYLNPQKEFSNWRISLRSYRMNKVYLFTYENNGKFIHFELKPNYRNRIKEIIIGKIHYNKNDELLLQEALDNLISKLKVSNVTILSFCNNILFEDKFFNNFIKLNFYKLNKSIYFITKNINNRFIINESTKWRIFRSDVDTW